MGQLIDHQPYKIDRPNESALAIRKRRAKQYRNLIRHLMGVINALWWLVFDEEPPKGT